MSMSMSMVGKVAPRVVQPLPPLCLDMVDMVDLVDMVGLVGKVAPRVVQPLLPLCLVSSKACKLSASMRSDHNMVTIAEHLQIAIKARAMQLLITLSNHLAQVN